MAQLRLQRNGGKNEIIVDFNNITQMNSYFYTYTPYSWHDTRYTDSSVQNQCGKFGFGSATGQNSSGYYIDGNWCKIYWRDSLRELVKKCNKIEIVGTGKTWSYLTSGNSQLQCMNQGIYTHYFPQRSSAGYDYFSFSATVNINFTTGTSGVFLQSTNSNVSSGRSKHSQTETYLTSLRFFKG